MRHYAVDCVDESLCRRFLAKAAGVGGNTVNRFEAGQDARVSSVDKMRVALESAGVEFIPENGGGAGVRLRKA
nr:transcriptional regulator [Mesorhizobium carmichaelinearum]